MAENLYTPDCIRTFSGQYVNVFDPDPDTILIEDIAHALSHQCRFGGHLPMYYSVAQHSVLCAVSVPSEHALAALLHDASEAYMLDIPSPIKKRLPEYKKLEDNLMQVIAKKFEFQYPLHDEVKNADKILLVKEWQKLMIEINGMESWCANAAKIEFMWHYKTITL